MPAIQESVQTGLASRFPAALVEQLLAAHREIKRHYYLGGLRLSGVEGGRFCEAAFRMLEHATTGASTPLGRQLDSDGLIRRLAGLPASDQPESIRLHIPRCLRVIYDIRNKRDLAHLADGIDPNLQDATLVVSVSDWVLAEFVRMAHGVSANEAQHIVNGIVSRAVPVIEEFGGYLKVLNSNLKAGDYCLLLLYQRGSEGATFDELTDWAKPQMRSNLRRTLTQLVEERAYAHRDGNWYAITRTGMAYVERNRLFEFPEI